MKENIREQYFLLLKTVGLMLFMVYQVLALDQILMMKAFRGLYMAIFLTVAVALELTGEKRTKYMELLAEGILTLVGVFLFPVSGIVAGLIFVEDFCSTLQLQPYWYLVDYFWAVLICRFGVGWPETLGAISFLIVLYCQEKVILRQYRALLHEGEEVQSELKTDIEKQNIVHEKEMQKSHLRFENQMLEDHNRISQALHDKLGHSINGSLYQLEAAKLLVRKKPEDCEQILQGVIDQLRLSMDEIRAILRSERPNKKRMALLSLHSLCEECESKYQIQTHLNVEDPQGTIPEHIWEIMLDNTYEAVTNALKYARCRNIYIDIIAMNEVVRCTIRDDGKGAKQIEEGMGLQGMRDRVRSVKGFISVESEMGFMINTILPLS